MSENAQNNSIDFSGLILGFSSASLYYLEQVETGKSEERAKNLTLATQNIDIIRLLKEKTQNNLTKEENLLIQQILTELESKKPLS